MKHSSVSWDAPSNFSVEIESLRGIAALSVLFGHIYLFLYLPHDFPRGSHWFNVITFAFFSPHPAVLLFFTMSGLVLGRQLRKEPVDGLPSFMAYLSRRSFRLIPLMCVTTSFAFMLYGFIKSIDLSLLYSTLLLKNITINPPIWSLKIELLCSIFFPLLFWIFRTSGIVYNILLFSVLVLLSYSWHVPPFLQYLVFFHAGLLADSISSNTRSVRFSSPTYLLLFCLVFIFASLLRSGDHGSGQIWFLPEILACPFILFHIVHHKNSSVNYFLRLPLVRYFGKLSFSIYLVHFPLLQFMMVKYPVVGVPEFIAFVISYFTLVILLASATYYGIEIPTNRLGRNVSSWILTRTKERVSQVFP